jgi:biopolymer transport protein ExbD
MSLLFECPQCGDRRSMAMQSIGRRVRCPACESLIEVILPENSATFQHPDGSIAPFTAELAEAKVQIITGRTIATPQKALVTHEREESAVERMPGVPVLALDDDEESEQKVVLRSKPEEAEMDMTPMVDVTFQLLIFFMLTASFAVQKTLPMPAPKEKDAASAVQMVEEVDESDQIVVRVDSFSTFHVSASSWDDEIECPSEQELISRIREARQGDGQGHIPTKLIVKAHGDAIHDRVVMAVDSGISVGFDNVQLITIEEDEN